jgi:hypothetical protein
MMFWTTVAFGVAALASPMHREEINFECDVPGGNFSSWSRKTVTSKFEIVGTIQLKEERFLGRWTPVANVMFYQNDRHPAAMLRVVAEPGQTDLALYYRLNSSEKGAGTLIGKIPKSTRPISIRISADHGKLQLEALPYEKTLTVADEAFSRMELSCSSGDFAFSDFVILEEQSPLP